MFIQHDGFAAERGEPPFAKGPASRYLTDQAMISVANA
jgi:hypothetical protein